MAKNGRQMMSHLTLKATPLLHTVHVQTQCTVEDFPILSFCKNLDIGKTSNVDGLEWVTNDVTFAFEGHTVAYSSTSLLKVNAVEVDFAQGKFKNISFF